MPKVGMEPIRRAALMHATVAEIAEHGTLDVPVARIASRAGMSSGLAHHYFGSKEHLFAATMRHILTLFGAEVRGALRMAHTPRQRIKAIIQASFTPGQFRSETVAAWLNFYVQALQSDQNRRLLNIYQRRLKSNLLCELKKIDPERAEILTSGTAAMIDGLYLQHALGQATPCAKDAISTVCAYLDVVLQEKRDEE